MNILITGGAGFIGLNYIKTLLKTKHNIICIDYLNNASNFKEFKNIIKNNNITFFKEDLKDYKKIKNILTKTKPNLIINFAAESHVDNSILNPLKFIESNIIGTFNLLESCRELIKKNVISNKSFKFVHISTDEVYGSLKPNEKKSNELSAYFPNSPYSASKASSDHLVRSYFKTYNLPTLTTHCTNNYGPWQNTEKLIPKIITNYLNGVKIPIYGKGKNIRDWIFVDDHLIAIKNIIKKGKIGEVYNISGKSQITNINLIKKIIKILNLKTNSKKKFKDLVEFVEDRKGHDFRYDVSSKKIENEVNFYPKTSLEKGLSLTVEWYIENYKIIQ